MILHGRRYFNFNNMDARMFAMGSGPWPAATPSAMSFDRFEWARLGGGSMMCEDPSLLGRRWTAHRSYRTAICKISDHFGQPFPH